MNHYGQQINAPRAARCVVGAVALLALAACGGGGGDNGPGVPAVDVTVSGRITYDRVPVNSATGGLDYTATVAEPARNVLVELVDQDGAVVASGETNSSGRYALDVAANRTLNLRVMARTRRTGRPAWDFQVVDNTSDNLLYAIESGALSVGNVDQTVNLRAESGWDGASYADPRAAAPFAILDTVYRAVELVLEADPDAVFVPLTLHWSPLNRESDVFDPDSGQIPTTGYIDDPIASGIYILGDEGIDTDEYDAHILAHEWGHYFEDNFARTDSVGGPHSITSRLDPRVAYSEGWSNAFSAMVLDDPLYVDTFGPQQSLGFSFDIENNRGVGRGWFNESSVHSILYDVFDDQDDGVDVVSLGFGPLYDAITTDQATSAALTTIFSLIPPLKLAEPGDVAGIDALVAEQQIDAVDMDIWASTETHDLGATDVLPVYADANLDGGAVTVCSNPQFGSFNGLGVRQFVRFEIGGSGRYRLTAEGPADSDPDFAVYNVGLIAVSESAVPGREVFTSDLDPGEYVLAVYEFGNLFSPNSGRTCIDVSVETAP